MRKRPAMWLVFGAVAGFWGGGWHRAGHRWNLGKIFQELERRPTMARTTDAYLLMTCSPRVAR